MIKKEKKSRYLNVKPLRTDHFVKVNKLQQVTSPIIFSKNGAGMQANPEGLLSHEIFGITQYDRSNTFAYVALGNTPFLSPLFYKILCKLDGKISACIHGTKKFVVKGGELVEDEENGECGIKFFKKVYDSLKFKSTGAESREYNIKFLKKFGDRMWIKDFIILPAYYRDVNSAEDAYHGLGVGDINKLYTSLIVATKSLEESAEYGISLSTTVAARIQDILVSIFDWITSEITGKRGIVNRAAISKTTDMSARLVLSAPNLKVENIDDMMVDVDHSAVPLAAVCANFFPYIIFWLRNFFQNQFSDMGSVPFSRNGNEVVAAKVKDPLISFSDEVLKEEIDRFIHGYAGRLRPIEVPVEPFKYHGETIKFTNMIFKGHQCTEEEFTAKDSEINKFPLQERILTWCDLLFMAAKEVTKDKMILVTRYPIDSCFNQFPTKVNVYSTKRTEPMVVNGTFYKNYPYITKELINSNTTNLFIDTLGISNIYLGSIGGDYKLSSL